jgi:hypothetical protein
MVVLNRIIRTLIAISWVVVVRLSKSLLLLLLPAASADM